MRKPKHPLWLRCSHWLNVPLWALLTWSGILIYWANDVYRPFFPDWFYDFFGIPQRLAEGMAIHFTLGWAFILNGLFYTVAAFLTGHWRELKPNRQTFRKLLPTILHDLHLQGGPPPAQGKFNAAQRIAYTGVFFLAGLEVLTGFLIYKPVQFGFLLPLFRGYDGARLVHFVVMWLLVLFFFLHVAQVARAGWKNFRAIVTGYEDDHER